VGTAGGSASRSARWVCAVYIQTGIERWGWTEDSLEDNNRRDRGVQRLLGLRIPYVLLVHMYSSKIWKPIRSWGRSCSAVGDHPYSGSKQIFMLARLFVFSIIRRTSKSEKSRHEWCDYVTWPNAILFIGVPMTHVGHMVRAGPYLVAKKAGVGQGRKFDTTSVIFFTKYKKGVVKTI
jgi:hypothetical protein